MQNIVIKLLITVTVIALPFGAYAKEFGVGDYPIIFDQKLEADTSGNGVNDRTSYYQGDLLVWTAYDEDENGEWETWFRYKGGDSVDLELYDRDGNGTPDRIVEVDAQEKPEVIYDAAFEGGTFSSATTTVIVILVLGGAGAGWYVWRKKKGLDPFSFK